MSMGRLVIVGAGGTGSHLISLISRMMRVDTPHDMVIIVDGDKYDQDNLDRQDFSGMHIGMNKAMAQVDLWNRRHNPSFNLVSIPEFIGAKNIDNIVIDGTVVMSCVDNHVARALLADRVSALSDGVLISSGNELNDGNVQIHIRRNGVDETPPIGHRHPEIMTTQDGDRSTMSCEALHAMPGGGQTMMANAMSACLMASLWSALCNDSLDGVEEIYFAPGAKFSRIVKGIPQ